MESSNAGSAMQRARYFHRVMTKRGGDRTYYCRVCRAKSNVRWLDSPITFKAWLKQAKEAKMITAIIPDCVRDRRALRCTCFSANPKVQELGRLLFAAGVFALGICVE